MGVYSRVISGMAACLCASSALAATPVQTASLDPLVALSALGTPQSRAAVAPVITAGAAQAVVATQYPPPPPGWPANRYPRPNQYYDGAWVFLPGLLGLLAILALHLSDDDDDGPDSNPISP